MTERWKDDRTQVRLKAMNPDDIAVLEARSSADPNSLSDDDRLILVRLEFHRTRARIEEIERRALERPGPDDIA